MTNKVYFYTSLCVVEGCNRKPEELMMHHCGKQPHECDAFEEDEEHCFFEMCSYHVKKYEAGKVTQDMYRHT